MKAKEYQLVVSKDLYEYGETIVNSNTCKNDNNDEQVFKTYNQAMIHV